MALKKKLSKAEYEKLNDELKKEYIQDGEGFKLDLDGEEDTGALRRAHERTKEELAKVKADADEARAALAALGDETARKAGDIATLEKSWQSKLDKQRLEAEERLSKLSNHVKSSLVDNVAQALATKISTAPNLMLPHIKARLMADFDGDKPTTRILDKDGKVSAMTIDELANELIANKDFSAIIAGSKASGGAKPGNEASGAAKFPTDDKVNLAQMKPTDLAERLKEKIESSKQA